MNRVAVTILALGLIASFIEAKPNFLFKKEVGEGSPEEVIDDHPPEQDVTVEDCFHEYRKVLDGTSEYLQYLTEETCDQFPRPACLLVGCLYYVYYGDDEPEKKKDVSWSDFSSSSSGFKTQKRNKMMAKKAAIMKALAKKRAMAKKAHN
ncbi:uncharacterized protein LOC117102101 [Anneissia japonica]|uniref:uncharacterized protein LOC117102101 n=1 Tax=Anneissia japonica TaxID=1529436 RepID=UPI0014255CDF|nr:uncharacterized protein LOC117102101 [Anneissia japonica]